MNEQEYNDWKADATANLLGKYHEEDVGIIMDWFHSMHGSDEYELTGPVIQECLSAIREQQTLEEGWLYNDLMMRVWLYAPMILKQHALENN